MTISIKLLETIPEIEKRVNEALSIQVNNILLSNQSKIVNDVIALIPKWLRSQPEIQALSSNELVGAFGFITSPSAVVNSIIDAVSQSVSIKFKKYNKNLSGGGFDLQVQPDDFANLLALPQGHTVYSGGDLHWLNWMLTRGDEIIVVGYEYNPKTGLGRTNLGNMTVGRGFRVPPQYSGTSDNNFITRALSGSEQEKDITKIFQSIFN